MLGGLATVGVVALALVLFGGSSNPYVMTVMLSNADGLTDGSPVNIGGVPVGAVKLSLAGQEVRATLDINRKFAPVGRDATAAVVAQNLLGQKQVEVSVGNRTDPAPSGFVVPAKQVTLDTDLTQVLQVLDPSTRARLSVLINEAGIAFTGRGLDLNQLIAQAPGGLAQGTALLTQLDSSNAALSDLLARSNRFVGTFTQQRSAVEATVNEVGQTAETVSAQRVALRQTLANAPAALTSARSLLADIQKTAPKLGNAAQLLTTTAAPLDQTLQAIGPFASEAKPALAEATTVAPDLVKLATKATPVLRSATPVLSQLNTFATTTLPPIWSTLNGSVDNIVQVLTNWSRVVELRDGLSHVFRGEASVAPDEISSALDRLESLLGKATTPAQKKTVLSNLIQSVTPKPSTPASKLASGVSATASTVPKTLSSAGTTVSKTLTGVSNTLSGVTKGLSGLLTPKSSGSKPSSTSTTESQTSSLLNYLLGK